MKFSVSEKKILKNGCDIFVRAVWGYVCDGKFNTYTSGSVMEGNIALSEKEKLLTLGTLFCGSLEVPLKEELTLS